MFRSVRGLWPAAATSLIVTTKARGALSLAAFAVALFALSTVVFAQGGGEPGMPPAFDTPAPEPFLQIAPIGGPISIDLHSVDARVDGPVAKVKVRQVFRNQTDATVEGVFIFPLPPDAAVSDFRMTVDGQVLEGKVMAKEEARRIYEEIVRSQRDPALLEYLGQNVFQTSVFPIPPGASRTLDFAYTQVLPQTGGLYQFHYPLAARQYGASPVKTLAMRVELLNQPGLRTVYSPGHEVSIQRTGDDAALVGFEASDFQAERDFDLYFGVSEEAIGLNLLSYKPAGEDGFFLVLAAPTIDVDPDAIVQRDVVLVMDVSGSMEGEKLVQAKEAARYVVQHLNPGDRLNLIAFSTGVDLWAEDLRPAGGDMTPKAGAWIDRLEAEGSTDINRALLEALGQIQARPRADQSRPAYVLFLTDGLPTQGEIDPNSIIRNAAASTPQDQAVRLFTFGVGYDVDTVLLDSLSAELGGRSAYVKPDERIDEKVSSFYSQVSTPVLADVSIDLPGAGVDETYPYPLPDLFAGEQLVWAGRYRQGGDVTVTLSGAVNGEKHSFTYPGQRLVQSGGESLVARLWATRKIGSLLEQIRRQGADPELVDAVVKLSTTYGVMTPYTSYLVLENEAMPMLRQGIGGDAGGIQPLATAAPAAERMTLDSLAAAPVSGESAVAASEVQQKLQDANRAADGQGVRYAAGKSFTLQGLVEVAGQPVELWVDSTFTAGMEPETVPFGSEAYFELAALPSAAAWLAVSPELLVVIDGKPYRVTAAAAPEPMATHAPDAAVTATATPPSATPAPAASSGSLWEAVMAWLQQIFGKP